MQTVVLVLALLVSCVLCSSLTVRVFYPLELIDTTLYLRGNILGLSWDSGVQLRYTGSNNQWETTLQFDDTHWNQTLEAKVLIDDKQWMVGANAKFLLEKSKSTSYTADIFPWFNTNKGTLEIEDDVFSPQLNNSRSVIVYLPPSFYENPHKIVKNVLVMHDGQNLFDPETAFMGQAWMCQDTVNGLLLQGAMDEIMIIGVYNTADRLDELTYSVDPKEGGGKGDKYLDFIEKQVLPTINKKYSGRIDMGNEKGRGILGSSLGGLISCYAGVTRSSFYAKAGCMSSSFWWNDEDFNGKVLNQMKPKDVTIYLDSGDQGPSQDDKPQTIAVREHLLKMRGFKMNETLFYYLDRGGEHNEKYWRERFWIPMKDLYPVSVNPITPH